MYLSFNLYDRHVPIPKNSVGFLFWWSNYRYPIDRPTLVKESYTSLKEKETTVS